MLVLETGGQPRTRLRGVQTGDGIGARGRVQAVRRYHRTVHQREDDNMMVLHPPSTEVFLLRPPERETSGRMRHRASNSGRRHQARQSEDAMECHEVEKFDETCLQWEV